MECPFLELENCSLGFDVDDIPCPACIDCYWQWYEFGIEQREYGICKRCGMYDFNLEYGDWYTEMHCTICKFFRTVVKNKKEQQMKEM